MQTAASTAATWIFFAFAVTVTSHPLFTCTDGTELPVTSLCDGKLDCQDQNEEIYRGRGFKCTINGNKRNCVLPQSLLYDDVAHCDAAEDICFDDRHNLLIHKCFRCLSGDQVVALTQVCDGVLDCDDFSDECLCQNVEQTQNSFLKNPICRLMCAATRESIQSNTSSVCGTCNVGEIACSAGYPPENGTTQSNISDSTQLSCISKQDVCNGVKDCPNGEDEDYCSKAVSCKNDDNIDIACYGKATCSDFSDECQSDCWSSPQHCKRLLGDQFYCSEGKNPRNSLSSSSFLGESRHVCNNVIINCPSSRNDKLFCSMSSHYYCWSENGLYINHSQRFDEVRNCDDGSDECSGLYNFSHITTFSKNDQLIQNPLLQALVYLMAFFALTGNTLVIAHTSRELVKDRHVERMGRLAKCNRTFVLNLAIADFMMGIYLLLLGINCAVYTNNYCVHDRMWRTGRMCISMGVITQISSQTSVFLLVIMTSFRLFGTLYPFKVEESRLLGSAAVVNFLAWVTSVALALLPQVHFMMEYFVDSYWVPLPFLNHDLLDRHNMEELILNIYTLSDKSSRSQMKDLQWRTMIDYVMKSNLTMSHPSWNKEKMVPIGFYNQYPTCQAFFYPDVGDTAWLYMTSIVFFNFLAFAYIAIAYLVIYKTSSRPCVRKSVRRKSKQWRHDNRKMQRKIFALVFTDMACWLPICIIMVLRLSGVHLHSVVHGVTGTILLPINSSLNPIVYSSFWKLVKQLFKRKRTVYRRHSSSIDASISLNNGAAAGSLLNLKFLSSNSPKISNNHKGGTKKTLRSNSRVSGGSKRVRFSNISQSASIEEEDNADGSFIAATSRFQVDCRRSTISIENSLELGAVGKRSQNHVKNEK